MPRLSFRALSLALVGYCALALTTPIAQASFVNLGPAGDFNVFVFNDNTQSGSDAEGRVAVGGDALFGMFSIASSMGASTDNLIVGGNMTNTFNSLKGGLLVMGNVNWNTPTISGRVAVNGDANFGVTGGSIGTPVEVGGTYTHPMFGYPSNTYTSPASLPFDFSEVAAYLTDMADSLASLPINGTTAFDSNNIIMTGASATFNNFYITAAQLAAGTGLTINAPAGSTVVVNVDGAAADFDSQGIFLNGVDKQHVLYNFHNATTLGINTIGILGSLLAPRADVNFAGGNIDGTLIANNLTGPGESHHFPFEGELPPIVPEPSSVALATLALSAFALRRNTAK